MITNFKNSNNYRQQIHDFIPGGCHTYSKGDDQFPELSPAAIKRGKGAYVWDIDDNKYLDCSMGLTSVSLGHAYTPVIQAVANVLDSGVNFQRPSYLELEAAKKFLSVVPGHDMIKFAKNGSSATTAAVKLARAFTQRKYVAFPSDHPFYSFDDWFISKTNCPKGVPEEIAALSLTFLSTDLTTLEDLFRRYPGQIACVITEPEKSNLNSAEYVKKISSLCKENGSLFIMDEMVTGFKTDFPGCIKKFGVTPDMATWGKGIANGFSFCALTGTKEVMELGGIRKEGEEKVFLLSSTHGGETTALAACIATIDEFEKNDVISHNHRIGRYFSKKIIEALSNSSIGKFIVFTESEWMPVFAFKNSQEVICSSYRTLFLQEMIKRGVLFQGAFVPCYSHTEVDVDFFVESFKEALKVYEKALKEGVDKFLVGKPTKPVFRKYL